MSHNQKKLLFLLGLLMSLSPSLVQAHTGSNAMSGWYNGFNHPLHGWDHLLTMLAVGVWAAQLGGRAVWQLPLAFVGVMSLGGLAGITGVSVPGVELMILLSVIVFGVLVVRRIRFQTTVSMFIVVFFAFFHGYAHGQEMPASASLLSFALGFMLATLLLHGAGIATVRLVALTFAFVLGSNVNARETEATTKDATEVKSKTGKNEPLELDEMVVTEDARAKSLIGLTASASQGEVNQAQFEYRPLSRNGELLEVVPGVLATQHSGSGKANQYFLRGFNLDHGTDFTTYVDGIPMNVVTHAHGQGYMDVNSIIPELVKDIDYGKGPYYAEVGDFSAAGYSKMISMDKLSNSIFKFTAGQYDYYRTLIANSNRVGDGDLLYAGEFNFYNGVWLQPEDSKKFNGMLRYTLNKDNWGTSVFAKAYNNTWTATNQIPQTAVDNGILNLYGTMDPSDGGDSNRFSLSSNLWNKGDNWKNDANIYALYYDLDLYSNFTGYLEDPVLGDQIHQFEHRVQTGGNAEHTRYNKLFGFDMDNTVGLQFRYDDIMNLGLDHTFNRVYLNTVTHNDVSEATAGIYFKNQTYWLDKLRTITGVRGDYIHNDVTETSNTLHDPLVNAANSGDSHKARVSPKLSVILGPWYNTEYFANAGYGYHSNDARGTVLHLNPVDGAPFTDGNPISPVTPLAWSRGAETGVRSNFIRGLNSTLSLWFLESSQELVFVGDAGTTEVNDKTHRYGVEFTNYYKPNDWLTLDADFAFTSSHFVTTPEGATHSYIPNSVGMVITTGATIVAPNGLFGTVRLRHFSNVPLNESGTLWAGSTSIVNLGTGYRRNIFKVELDIFNIFGSVANDIAYAYDYAYPADAEPQYGIMKHPVEPRMVRGTISLNF